MRLDWEKHPDRLIPAVVQDAATRRVVMLGYMNEESLGQTIITGRVTFYSRSRKRLWTKGEQSGNFLELISISSDCDNDTLLVLARRAGPVCHTGADTCFGEENFAIQNDRDFLSELGELISERRAMPKVGSYVSSLFEKGINSLAQKVGEEAVETVIAAKDNDIDAFIDESADLLFHLMVLLEAKGVSLDKVSDRLQQRHEKAKE